MSAPPAGGSLELRLLGTPQVWREGREVRLPVKKMLGLLAYLALEGSTPRARLANLFWSENDEESARRNLRVELHRLREAGLGEYLQGDERIGVVHVQTDVQSFEEAVGSGHFEQALALYRGALLEGLELPGAQGFWEWLEPRREGLAARWRRAMLSQAENLETRGDWRGALEIHLRLLAEDDLQERHHREVMRLHYLLGEREAALERFERLKNTLRRELGLEPLPETLSLLQQIRSAQALSSPPVAARPLAPALSLQVPLVGRGELWERMEAAWAAGQFIVLMGEPGVGKTRMMRDFAASKGLFEANEGRPTDPGVPFATLTRSIRSLLRRNPGLRLRPWVRRELARLVPELHDEPPPPLRSPEERLRLYDAFVEFMDQATRHCVALLSDDLQFFDSASVEMGLYGLRRFLERGDERRTLTAFRQGELIPEVWALVERAMAQGQGVLLELGPLAEPELLELLRQISGSEEGRLFTRRLYRVTAGNPFFVLETLKTLFESKLLSVNPQGGWETPFDEETTDYRELPIPASVREAVLRRVSHLGEAVRRLLEAASLAGDGFSLETLSGATALSEWEGLEALERAVEARLLEAMPGGGYRFSHDLFAQSLAEALSPERKRLLHLKLAQSLERLEGPPARIALHLEQAGRPREAASWFVKAARVAEDLYAWGDARALYGRALGLGLGEREAFQAHAGRYRCWWQLRDASKPTPDLEAMHQLAERLGDPALRAHALRERVWFLHACERYEEALREAEALLALPGFPAEDRAKTLLAYGDALTSLGRLEEARARYLEGLEIQAGQVSFLTGVLQAELAVCCWYQGDYQTAAHHNDMATRIYTAIGDSRGEVRTLATAGIIATSLGQTDRAIQFFQRAIARARETGFPVLHFNALTNLIEIYLEQAEFDQARPLLEEAFAVVGSMNRPSHTAQLLTQQSALCRAAGSLGAAVRVAYEAVDLVDGVGERNAGAGHRLILAGLLLDLGDAKGASQSLAEVGELLAGNPHQHTAEFETLLARLEALENPAAGLARLETLRGSEASFDHIREKLFWQTKARVLLALGDPQAALEAAIQVEDSPTLPTLFLRLEAGAALESVDPELIAQAERQLKRLPPLEALELSRALIQAYKTSRQSKKIKKLQQEATPKVQGLAATLEDYPELMQSFLCKNQDLLE